MSPTWYDLLRVRVRVRRREGKEQLQQKPTQRARPSILLLLLLLGHKVDLATTNEKASISNFAIIAMLATNYPSPPSAGEVRRRKSKS